MFVFDVWYYVWYNVKKLILINNLRQCESVLFRRGLKAAVFVEYHEKRAICVVLQNEKKTN